MTRKNVIHWFRQDLRLQDNPALYKAAEHGAILPIYILDDINAGPYKMGAASRWWLHQSLCSLNQDLDGKLALYVGDPLTIIPNIIRHYNIEAIYWNRCYEPWRISRDKKLKSLLQNNKINVFSENGSLLWEPWEVLKQDGTPYKVFTPFYQRGCLEALPPREPISKPRDLQLIADKQYAKTINKLNLLPTIPWFTNISEVWQVGEDAAIIKLKNFLSNGLNDYKEGRNFPARKSVSRLSPHLHFGEISPNMIWHMANKKTVDENLRCFLSELGWREFSYSLLYYFPNLPDSNWKNNFNQFPWRKNKQQLIAWQKGLTGYPIIDAGMRELWQTGQMHNRVRMIVASFLVKNLLLDWRHGAKWFWDCLVDADLASNSASWQWVAGSGADAAPYFRIFNPVLQGQKFDENGEYTRHYVPELGSLPNKYLFSPWEAPQDILDRSGVILGKTYPKPIVDFKYSRELALAAYDEIKNG